MRLTDEEKLEIAVMYRSGLFHIREIAEWIGCSKKTVMKYLDYKTKGDIKYENNWPKHLDW